MRTVLLIQVALRLRSKFSQTVYKTRAHSRLLNAEFVSQVSFGHLLLFLEFEWQGEHKIVAIVRPWEGEAWINIAHSPDLLIKTQRLQVIDVNNIL